MSSFVCLDLGASNTRYCNDDGIVHLLPNNIAVIDEGTNTFLDPWAVEGFEDQIRENLDVSIEKISGEASDFFPVRALIGSVANRYGGGERPNANSNKYQQRINYISAIVSTAISMALEGNSGDVMNDVNLFVALPPVEARLANKYVSDQLVGEYKVTFNMMNAYVKLNITTVKCIEESNAALLSFFFDGLSLNEKAKKYSDGYVLSIDIGASTTDIITVLDRKFIERTGKTIKSGGNIVKSIVKDNVQALYGFEPEDAESERAVAEGRIKSGASYIDVSGIVTSAKRDFAVQIVNEMQTYFKQIGVPIQTFSAIVVSGGGSMRGEYCDASGNLVKTSEPMSFFITEKLKTICDTIIVEHIEDGPRLANIKGLYLRALFNKASIEKEKRSRMA